MIRVVNKYHRDTRPDEVVVNIMRGTTIGNPFPMKDKSQAERDRVCDEYNLWLRKRYADASSPQRRELERLADLVASGQKLALECCCAPLRCHGLTIKAAIEGILRLRGKAA